MLEKLINELLASNEVTFEVLNKAENSELEELIYIKKKSKHKDKRAELTVKDLNILKDYNITEFITKVVKEEVKNIYTYCNASGYIFTIPKDEELAEIVNESSESGTQDLYLNTIGRALRKIAFPYFTIAKIEVVISDNVLDSASGNSSKPIIYSIAFKTGKGIDDLIIYNDCNDNKVSSTNFSFTEEAGHSMVVEKSINLIYEKYKKIADEKVDHLERVLAILTSTR